MSAPIQTPETPSNACRISMHATSSWVGAKAECSRTQGMLRSKVFTNVEDGAPQHIPSHSHKYSITRVWSPAHSLLLTMAFVKLTQTVKACWKPADNFCTDNFTRLFHTTYTWSTGKHLYTRTISHGNSNAWVLLRTEFFCFNVSCITIAMELSNKYARHATIMHWLSSRKMKLEQHSSGQSQCSCRCLWAAALWRWCRAPYALRIMYSRHV